MILIMQKISKNDYILLEYQKIIPKSLRIITNISHTAFFKELNDFDIRRELTEEVIKDFFEKNIWRFPIPNIFFKDTKYEIVFRNHTEKDNYSMNWHYDNKQLIKHKISNLQKIHSLQIVTMDDKYIYGLYCKNPIHFTIIIYLDTYNIDFEGGEFHFHDKIIHPEKGMLLYFDANELHKVSPLTGGKRRAIVVKIF